MDKNLESLVEIFRQLGVEDPDSWAESEKEEGIPQLAMYLFLRLAVQQIKEITEISELRKMLNSSRNRGATEAFVRLSTSLETEKDFLLVLEFILKEFLSEICFHIDDTAASRFSGWPHGTELEKVHWGLFQLDDEGNPVSPMAGLHELVFDFL